MTRKKDLLEGVGRSGELLDEKEVQGLVCVGGGTVEGSEGFGPEQRGRRHERGVLL